MTLPTSGPISLGAARNEFGLGNPVSLSQFRGRGSVPGSGSASLSQLRGASNASWDLPSGYYVFEDQGSAGTVITCTVPCVWTWTATHSRGYVSPANGGTATSFSAMIEAFRSGGLQTYTDEVTINVTGTAGAASAQWTLQLRALGNDGGPID